MLATTDPDKVLPTVLSRCLQFNLRPMPPEVVREHLAQVLQAEGLPFDDGALRLLGRAARGSMRDALSLTDQAIAYGGGRLDQAVVRAMLGTVDRGHAVRLVQSLAVRDGRAVLQAVDALRGLGLSASGTLEEVAALLQQMAVAQAVPDALDGADPEHQDALRLAPALAADETQLLYSMVLQGRSELSLMSDEYAALTMVLLRFLAFAPAPAVAMPAGPLARTPAPPSAPVRQTPVLTPRVADPEIPPWADEGPPPDQAYEPRSAQLRAAAPAALLVPAPRPARASTAAPAQPATALSAPATTALGERWFELAQRLAEQGRINALVRELAWQAGVQACVDGRDGCTWTLTVERDSLRTDSLRDRLAAALSAELGSPQRVELQAGVPVDSVARREAWERQRRQAEAEQVIRDDPAVQELLAQFKTARVVPGTIKPL